VVDEQIMLNNWNCDSWDKINVVVDLAGVENDAGDKYPAEETDSMSGSEP